MATIDVSELLSDPDFVDPISVVTRTPSVNSLGENSLTETTRLTQGSVQPASGRAVARLPEALRVDNFSSFWIRGELAVSPYPILLTFRGQTFEVKHVFNWTNWGQGWCEGLCVARPML